MQMPKPTELDKSAFVEALAGFDGAVVKPMFGNLGAFVNGNMFAGLFGSDLGVRLTDEHDAVELRAVPGTGPYGPPERPMGSYIALPADWSDTTEFTSQWLGKAFDQVASLPPKAPRGAKA